METMGTAEVESPVGVKGTVGMETSTMHCGGGDNMYCTK